MSRDVGMANAGNCVRRAPHDSAKQSSSYHHFSTIVPHHKRQKTAEILFQNLEAIAWRDGDRQTHFCRLRASKLPGSGVSTRSSLQEQNLGIFDV